MHYAILTNDDASGATYGQVKAIPGAVTAKIQPKSNAATLYSDDGPSDTAISLGEVDVTIEMRNLPTQVQADLLGHTVDGNGVLVRKTTDQAPYVAFGFRSRKSNGNYRYVWLAKGMFQVPEDDYQTEEDKPAFQTASIVGTFVRRDYDQVWEAVGDQDDPGFTGAATWFNTVYGASSDTTPPTVTTTPADAAANVPDNSYFVWTFNEAIQASCVTSANFFLMKGSDGTLVNGTLSLSGDQKTVTFTPTGALAATTAYIAVATTNVKDLAGNALAANSVTNFTTA